MNFNKWKQSSIKILAVVTGMYQLYIAAFGANSTMGLRATHWVFMSALCFLVYPLLKKENSRTTIAADLFLMAAAVAPGLYLLATWQENATTIGLASTNEVILGILLTLTVLETARRTAGAALTIISGLFLLYAMFGHLIPGVLGHREYSLKRIVSYLYLSSDGIYGIALGISATYIVLFVLFGSILNASGAGQLFMDLALGATGRSKGGPAKAAIVGSAVLGTVSGSPVGNVVTSGTYTIPLMKKAGYKDYEAGAIEAVASTGGMIVPPIMGAAAFIMADYLSLPYSRIMIAAILPAFLYYLALYCCTHFRAYKNDVAIISEDELPDPKASFKKNWYLLIPLFLMIIWLGIGWSPMKAAFYAIACQLIIMFVGPTRKGALSRLMEGIEDGIKNAIPVAAATAVAGIIVGVVNLTGLAVKFSTFMLSISGGQPLIMLFAIMIASLILGMGLPATAVYILLATLSVPPLVEVGFSPLAAHMFVFYFGIISAITPPVALSAYAAAGIAKSNPNRTGLEAFRFGLVAYIVPFIFVYNPAMLMEGSTLQLIEVIITSILAVVFFSIGCEGFVKRKLTLIEQFLCFAGSVLLMVPNLAVDAAGIVVIAIFTMMYRSRSKNQPFEEVSTYEKVSL